MIHEPSASSRIVHRNSVEIYCIATRALWSGFHHPTCRRWDVLVEPDRCDTARPAHHTRLRAHSVSLPEAGHFIHCFTGVHAGCATRQPRCCCYGICSWVCAQRQVEELRSPRRCHCVLHSADPTFCQVLSQYCAVVNVNL